MKRIISILLVIVVLFTDLSLSGCVATTADTALTMGQWVALIADSFGMQNYIEEEPYFKNVTSSDMYFEVFQMAAEWDIIEPSDTINSSTPVKWNDVLISLVNAGDFLDENATDEEKIDFAIANFDSNIRLYWGNRYIKLKEAVPLLDTAQQLWANKVYTEKIETVSFSDAVIDHIQNESLGYMCQGNVVTSSSDELMSLQIGDVYTLPANESNSASINKVKSIEYVDGSVVITNDDNFTENDLAEYIQEIKIQETSSPDFTQVAGIYDEYGNPIEFEIEDISSIDGLNSSNSEFQLSTLAYNPQDTQTSVVQTGIFDNVKTSISFKVGQYSVSLTFTKDDVAVQLSKEISKTTNRYREEVTKIYGKVKFGDVELTRDVDYSWGTLHSATVKLDYKTTIEGGLKRERTTEIGNPIGDGGETTKSLSSIIRQYENALSTLTTDVRNSKCDDDIYICRISLLGGWLASVDFIIKGKVTAEGEMKLVFEIEGSQGIQYKNGKLRYVKSEGTDCDFVAEGGIEVTIGPGIALTILGKIAIVELTVDAGLGASVGMTSHLFDVEGHELYSADVQLSAEDAENLANEKLYTTSKEIEEFAKQAGASWNAEEKGIMGDITLHKGVCLEWKLYPILRFSIGGLIAELVKVNASVEFLGKKNTKLAGHIDFPNNISNMLESESYGDGLATLFGIGASCTYDYTPWDSGMEVLDKIDPDAGSSDIITSETIILSTMRVTLQEGESQNIMITGLPNGYELKDLVAESEDIDIAKIDIKNELIIGNSEGTTQIVVKTSDGKYSAYCAVTVTTNNVVNFDGLSDGVEV